MPTFATADYEHARFEAFRHARCVMVPSVVSLTSLEKWGVPARVVRSYEGLKEQVYLSGFKPSPDMRRRLGISADEILVTFRPIAEHAHYGNGNGNELQRRLLDELSGEKRVRVIVLPRTERQRRAFSAVAAARPAIRLGEETIDGPSLISASDLVVTGGGTMLREAAVLGVPAVSCFSGPLGAVDRWLAGEGRVTLVRGIEDLRRIPLRKRATQASPPGNGVALGQIVQGICDAAEPE
jgi:predicted glycosyltransferase